MEPALITAVEASVERICDKGCRRVWEDIAALERNESLPEIQGLSSAQRAAVLAELKAIMAVYGGGRCSLG